MSLSQAQAPFRRYRHGDVGRAGRRRKKQRRRLGAEEVHRSPAVAGGDRRTGVDVQTETDPHILTRLARHGDTTVRALAIFNRSTPVEVVEAAVDDPERAVRYNVSGRPDISPDLLRRLSYDSDRSVRYGVAFNPTTPLDVLERLRDDPDPNVRARARTNPRTPVVEEMPIERRRSYAAAHPAEGCLSCRLDDHVKRPGLVLIKQWVGQYRDLYPVCRRHIPESSGQVWIEIVGVWTDCGWVIERSVWGEEHLAEICARPDTVVRPDDEVAAAISEARSAG